MMLIKPARTIGWVRLPGDITLDQLAQAIANAAKANNQAVKAGYATGGPISARAPVPATASSLAFPMANT